MPYERKRYYLVACEILFREVCFCAAKCDSVIDVVFMPKALHDVGEEKMSERLQRQIDQADPQKHDAILLCYGLCNYGVRGLHAPVPIALPRAHDCITLLMGSKDKYSEYYFNNTGTYFHSSGWIERHSDSTDSPDSISSQIGIKGSYEQYKELYGEENAEYLMETLGDGLGNYKKVAYINTGIGSRETGFEYAKDYAAKREWEFEEIPGDLNLIMSLLNGNWSEDDFLVVPPNSAIDASYDETIVRCGACAKCN